MYQAHYNKNGSLKHSPECQMAFGRKDENCPRCVEMLNGAQPRAGWQQSYYKMKKLNEQRDLDAIAAHAKNCKCGSFCTFGEW